MNNMKSQKNQIMTSMVLVNILIIMMLSVVSIMGFLQMVTGWENGLSVDSTAALNNIISDKFPGLTDISELTEDEIGYITEKAFEPQKGRLRSITVFTNNGTVFYINDFSDIYDNPPEKEIAFRLMKWISDLKHQINRSSGGRRYDIKNNAGATIGQINYRSVPLMGVKYAGGFDQIITRSFFIGIIAASIISILISTILSRNLSKKSRAFADQLTRLADGERSINFISGTTLELQSSAEAAASLQSQLIFNEKTQLQKLQDIIHDLKTPVSAVNLQFEAVSDGVLKMDDNRIRMLTNEFNNITEIIEELSRYTKLSSEDYIPEPELFDVKVIISEVIKLFELKTQAKGLNIIFNKPDIPMLVISDKLGIVRVINNLIINAINNAPENTSIGISVNRVKHLILNTDLCMITIENKGQIKEEDLPFLFDRLYRSKRAEYHGSGLGLAISKKIVEKNSGRISVANKQNNIVEFRVELPVSSN